MQISLSVVKILHYRQAFFLIYELFTFLLKQQLIGSQLTLFGNQIDMKSCYKILTNHFIPNSPHIDDSDIFIGR